MIFDVGKTVKELIGGRTVEQLKEDSLLCSSNITGNSNPYRDKGFVSSAKELMFYIDVLTTGLQDHVVMANNGRWKVMNKYWFFSQSGKWSVVGSSTIYRSKGFSDFVERFLPKDLKAQSTKYADNDYLFQIVDGVHTAMFGKYKGKTLQEVKQIEESYWRWAVQGARVQGIEDMTYEEVCNL